MKLAKRKDGIYATADRSAWLDRDKHDESKLHLRIRRRDNSIESHVFCRTLSEAQNTLDLYHAVHDIVRPHVQRVHLFGGWTVDTICGPMRVSVNHDWIACCFEDVDRAVKHFGRDRINPHSGKWNHGCGSKLKAAEMAALFAREFARVAPLPVVPTPERPWRPAVTGRPVDNDDRADFAHGAVEAYAKAHYEKGLDAEDLDTILGDLLSDMHHLAEREGLDLAAIFERASGTYKEEKVAP